MNFEQTLVTNAPFIGEIIFLMVIMFASIGEFTYIDITTHDIYALPWGELCYTGNTNADCKHIQDITNCPNGGDACIEAKYASMLTEEVFWLGGLMIFIKGALIAMFKRKVTATRIFQTVVWGLSPVILLFTGFEDYLYYAVRHMAIPPQLPWLDQAGLFPIVNNNILHVSTSTSLSLYIVMAIGMSAVFTMFAINTYVTKLAKYKTPI